MMGDGLRRVNCLVGGGCRSAVGIDDVCRWAMDPMDTADVYESSITAGSSTVTSNRTEAHHRRSLDIGA
jgi:hypothetical protein